MKTKTLEEVRRTQEKAVRFVRDVLRDDARADEIEEESPESYADRKRIEIVQNPRKETRPMPRKTAPPTRTELLEENQELKAQVEELESKLDSIADLVNESDEDEDDEDSDDDDDESDSTSRSRKNPWPFTRPGYHMQGTPTGTNVRALGSNKTHFFPKGKEQEAQDYADSLI